MSDVTWLAAIEGEPHGLEKCIPRWSLAIKYSPGTYCAGAESGSWLYVALPSYG